MGRFRNILKSFKKIKTTNQAIEMGLTFYRNIYGDEINYCNHRSEWIDEYHIVYACDEVFDFKNEIKKRKIKIKKILNTKKIEWEL